MEQMVKQIEDIGQKYEEKSALLDSLSTQNQNLQNELKLLAAGDNNSTANIQIQYVKDTVYLTEIKEKPVEIKKIIKDTVYIEVPVMTESEELMTDINNPLESNNEKRPNIADYSKKDNPRSIQFNFRKVNSEKD